MNELLELASAARAVLMYRYCVKDGAGRVETNEGIARAFARLAEAIRRLEK